MAKKVAGAPAELAPTQQFSEAQAQGCDSVGVDAQLWRLDPARAYVRWIETQTYGAANEARYRQRSIKQFASMFGRFARWMGESGRTDVEKFGEADIERFFETLNKRGEKLAITTARRYLWILASVVNHLNLIGVRSDPKAADGSGVVNPAKEMSLREDYRFVEPAAPAFLRHGQEQRYIEWVKSQHPVSWVDVRDKAFRLVFIASGITLEEARRLVMNDVVLIDGEVVELQIAPRGHGHYARTVPVMPWARDEITQWFLLRSAIFTPSDAFFLARSTDFAIDEPGTGPISATDSFVCVQAAIQSVVSTNSRHGPMTLRHTFTAMQLLRGVKRNILKEWLGLQTEEMVAAVARQIPALGEMRD